MIHKGSCLPRTVPEPSGMEAGTGNSEAESWQRCDVCDAGLKWG